MGLFDAILDASVLWSFDQSGFLRHAARFDRRVDALSLTGKTILVTGANSGLGLATSEALAARGAEVWLLCRSEERGRAAVQAIQAKHHHAKLRLELLDVSSRASVEAFAARLPLTEIDVLIHNAGVLPDARVLTEDGLESCLATNVAGPYLLTALLLPRLERRPGARVLTVSSGGMYLRRLDLSALLATQGAYDGVDTYANTKRAELILNAAWARRHPGGNPSFHAMHPGWADTPAVRSSLPRFYRWMKGRLRTPEQGADTLVWLASVPQIPGPSGSFWFDRALAEEHVLSRTKETEEEANQLWRWCLEFSRLTP